MGETDISGLRLLEAHLGLDWAAEGLDLPSLNTAPPHLHSYPYIFILFKCTPAHLCTELFSTSYNTYTVSTYVIWYTQPLHTRYLVHAAPTQILSQSHYLPVKTPSHAHSFPTNIPLSANTTVTPHLSFHYVDILPPFI